MAYRLRVPSSAEEQVEDIFYGQITTIEARWFLIAGMLLMTLWGAKDVSDVQLKILPVLLLIIINFFLHGRYMIERPAGRVLIWLSSLLDVLIVSVVISLGLPRGQFGLENPFFIFYYPVLLSFALVFAREITAIGIFLTCIIYAGICLLAGLGDQDGAYALVIRLATLATTGIVGTMYWRIEREGRRRAERARGALLKELGESGSR